METKDINDAVTMIARGIEILNQGPLNYTLDVLAASHQLLVTKYSPYKVGDRVVLTKEIDFMEAPGWQNHKHFLKVGALATVHTVSVYTKSGRTKEDSLVFGISFDSMNPSNVFTFDESYICHERDYKHPVLAPILSKDFKESKTYKLGKIYQELAHALCNPNTQISTLVALQEKYGLEFDLSLAPTGDTK